MKKKLTALLLGVVLLFALSVTALAAAPVAGTVTLNNNTLSVSGLTGVTDGDYAGTVWWLDADNGLIEPINFFNATVSGGAINGTISLGTNTPADAVALRVTLTSQTDNSVRYYVDAYQVTVSAGTGGTASVDKELATAGQTVTITTSAAAGYEVDTVDVKDANNDPVAVTNNQFTMPASNVTVRVTFKDSQPVYYPPITYPATVADAENGSVTVSPKSASSGSTVTITATPDDGYEVNAVKVTDASGNAVAVTDNGDGTYSFRMPSGKVTVTATFKETVHICPSEDFTDLDTTQWYHEAVDYVLSNGIMNGNGDGTFSPNGTLNRAMMVQILYNMENRPAVSGKSVFTDVSETDWYFAAVKWAADNNIVNGVGNDEYAPLSPITREQMATILYRYASYKGYDVSARGNLSRFTDGAETSDWAKTAMEWAVGVGIIQGNGNGTVNPTGTAKRCEIAQLMMNFCEKIVK